jgi:phosphoribosylformylglycinamidine synthase
VSYKKEDPRGDAVKEKFNTLGFSIDQVSITDNYLVNIDFNEEEIISAASLLIQPVTQEFKVNTPFLPDYTFNYCIETGFLPGVTDNVSHTVRESFEDLFKREFDSEKSVFYTTSYYFKGIFQNPTLRI